MGDKVTWLDGAAATRLNARNHGDDWRWNKETGRGWDDLDLHGTRELQAGQRGASRLSEGLRGNRVQSQVQTRVSSPVAQMAVAKIANRKSQIANSTHEENPPLRLQMTIADRRFDIMGKKQ